MVVTVINAGAVNPAGDSMHSIADFLGLSKVLRYLEDLGSGLKGECVVTDVCFSCHKNIECMCSYSRTSTIHPELSTDMSKALHQLMCAVADA